MNYFFNICNAPPTHSFQPGCPRVSDSVVLIDHEPVCVSAACRGAVETGLQPE